MKNNIKFLPLLLLMVVVGFGCSQEAAIEDVGLGEDGQVENSEAVDVDLSGATKYKDSYNRLVLTTPSGFIVENSDGGAFSAYMISNQEDEERITIVFHSPIASSDGEDIFSAYPISYSEWLVQQGLIIQSNADEFIVGGNVFDTVIYEDEESFNEDYYSEPMFYTASVKGAIDYVVTLTIDSPITDDMQIILNSIIFIPSELETDGAIFIPGASQR